MHHITLTGADRQTSIDFGEGVLGMPFVFEAPNLDSPGESHLCFEAGDGRLTTIFTSEERAPGCTTACRWSPAACTASRATSPRRPSTRSSSAWRKGQIDHLGPKGRGFMDSISFTVPLGLLIERATYRFEPPVGHTHSDVLLEAHPIRVAAGDYNVAQLQLAEAIENLVARTQGSLFHRSASSAPRGCRRRSSWRSTSSDAVSRPSASTRTC